MYCSRNPAFVASRVHVHCKTNNTFDEWSVFQDAVSWELVGGDYASDRAALHYVHRYFVPAEQLLWPTGVVGRVDLEYRRGILASESQLLPQPRAKMVARETRKVDDNNSGDNDTVDAGNWVCIFRCHGVLCELHCDIGVSCQHNFHSHHSFCRSNQQHMVDSTLHVVSFLGSGW